uniref:Transposase IS30-like HTH domain-containing protein n=1 Tax=uncultured prokaryote TaxID=198431 RepID=A0A0H5PZG3_9ZZZZ|nr:hypothetical protein [uncultured prokaryote]
MSKREPIRARREESATVLAKRFNVHPTTIRRTVSEERSEYLSWTSKRREDIRAYRAEHPEMSMRAIAAHFECSIGTVHNALHETA